MNPFTLLFRLPLMPLSKVIQLGEVLHDHAEQQLRDPASVRRQLEQAEQAHAAGQISGEELARVQAQAIDRLLPAPANGMTPAAGAEHGELICMAERRSARTIRHHDDDDDELAGDELASSADDEFADDDAGLTAAQAARAGLRQIAELTGQQAEGITGVGPADDGWMVGIEVVEDRRIPSSSDILATYETGLDMDGELLSYRRVGRYPRGRADRGI